MRFGTREGADDDPGELAEINVTPFIDVMLVLLIVFMVAAPLSTVDVPVRLPASGAEPGERPPEPLWLTLTREGALVLGAEPVAPAELGAALDARTGGRRDTAVFLRADGSISYDNLMGTLGLLQDAGYLSVALVGLEGGGT